MTSKIRLTTSFRSNRFLVALPLTTAKVALGTPIEQGMKIIEPRQHGDL
jgi:hypothetical protein